ncbi:MAG: SDR family oxidoreductase [Alphaproteobacteria bacterium]|nr:SDR family oxidoreductase [Alphaproteobacteria bacterium]
MDLGLKGKKAIVTGGTRGIGAAVVAKLLEEGASVAFCARREEEVAARVKEWTDAGYRVFGDVVDVRQPAGYLGWLDKARNDLGGVDIFVPNVSGGAGQGEEGWQVAFEVDLLATVRGCESLLAHMVQGGSGAIVVLASIAGLEAMGAPSPYNTVKAGLIAYASQLGDLAAQHGVRVNTVSPGPIHVDNGFWGDVQRSQPETYQSVAERHPFKRLGTVEEVANCVAFLASPAASWVARTNMIIDGGFTRRIQF